MIKDDWWKKTSDHLGGIYPFYDLSNPSYYTMNIEEIITKRRSEGRQVDLDIIAVACKACLPYLFGNRTLIKNVNRTPWMSHYIGEGKWEQAKVPLHSDVKPKEKDLIEALKSALHDEMRVAIEGANRVGILLSGGMDSRIVAGVLRSLQIESDFDFDVVALTWGKLGSRDVEYSRKISEIFSWDFEYLSIEVEDLKNNIVIAGQLGAEFSGSHLHALPKVGKVQGIDVVLAGSYGDMIGRAEFSGKHLTSLTPILNDKFDKFSILKNSVKDEIYPDLLKDVSLTINYNSTGKQVALFEMEQAMHYMRRMLQSCMSVVAETTRIYQMFSSPSTFSLMWALEPTYRDNRWYRLLLEELPGQLIEIPWARTGVKYLSEGGKPDNLSKSHHSYGLWLRHELKDFIKDKVNSQRIRDLNIFNSASLDIALNVWSKGNTKSISYLDETMSWLASLDIFLERNNLDHKDYYPYSFKDYPAAVKGGINSCSYVIGRNLLRK